MSNLNCSIGETHFKNPIIMASGTFGFGSEYDNYFSVNELGGFCGKGLTLAPKAGNPGRRVWETDSGMLNSVGLENPGIPAFLENEAPLWETYDTACIVNLGGNTIDDYVQGTQLLHENEMARRSQGKVAIEMIELNISCPNVKEGGMAFGLQCHNARKVVSQVRKATSLPLIVKLSPNAENIVEMAQVCEDEGADAVSLINTISAMKIDIRKRQSVFQNLYAGLSGPAIKPIALRMVHQISKKIKIPIIGMGGISSGEDIIEFIMAGATAIQVGTYNFVNLSSFPTLKEELLHAMDKLNIKSLDEIRGAV